MKNLPNSRAFERSTFSSFKKYAGDSDIGVDSRKYKYKTLMQVSICNPYYNESNGQCQDFNIYPTSATLSLMKKIGLIFKEEKTGFLVLYNSRAEERLLRYLKNQGSVLGNWSKLSFVAALNNPFFVNFTDLPFSVNLIEKNIYLSNQMAHQYLESILLNSGDYVSPDVRNFTDVISTQYVAPFQVEINGKSLVAKKIKVVDLSGETVFCKIKDPTLEVVYLDFSVLPEGLYSIQWFNNKDEEIFQKQVIYTATYPTPLCFIDLLFCCPTDTASGIYPVIFDAVGGHVGTVSYQLKFKERKIRWVYWVVPSVQSVENMRIKPDGTSDISFSDPQPGYIPTGQKAWSFVSNQTIPMQERSPLRFKLVDRLSCQCEFTCECKSRVVVNPMPLVSSTQVLSRSGKGGPATKNDKYSEVYVYV